MYGLPQLTVHSVRCIYATKLYLNRVPKDAIKEILGVDERTLKYYIKAMQERKKSVLFTHLEEVSALPKTQSLLDVFVRRCLVYRAKLKDSSLG